MYIHMYIRAGNVRQNGNATCSAVQPAMRFCLTLCQKWHNGMEMLVMSSPPGYGSGSIDASISARLRGS